MRILVRATLALVGVCCAFSTSQAFWWHHKGGHGSGAGYAEESCAKGACAAPVTYVPETKDVCVTRYRQEIRLVPETVVQRVTTMVPRVMAPPTGCQGYSAGAGCQGYGGGCYGSVPKVIAAADGTSDGLATRLALMETKLATLETKFATLEIAISDALDPVKGVRRGSLPAVPASGTAPPATTKPAGAVPVGNSPPHDTDPLAAAARAFKEGQSPGAGPDGRDDLLAAARAFKARQAGAQSPPASPAAGPTTAAARLAAGSP